MDKKSNSDLGSVQVHKKVLKEIIHTAVLEIEGLTFSRKSFLKRLLQLVGIGKYCGVIVCVNGRNEVSIEVKVFIQYGLNIPMTARKVQDQVKSALEKSVQINLKNIDVNIKGIER